MLVPGTKPAVPVMLPWTSIELALPRRLPVPLIVTSPATDRGWFDDDVVKIPPLTVRSWPTVIADPSVVVPLEPTTSWNAIPAEVTVPPAKATVEVPASSDPPMYVQPPPVRIVPARLRIPDGLSMTTRGRVPGDRAGGAAEGLVEGAVDQERGRTAAGRRGLCDRTLGSQAAGPVDGPGGEGQRAADGQRRAGGEGRRRPQVDVVEGVAAGDRAAGEDDGRGARGDGAGDMGPAGGGPNETRQAEDARRLVDDDWRQRPGGRRGKAGEGLVGGAVDQQARRPAAGRRRLGQRTQGGQRAGPVEAARSQRQRAA